MISNRQAVLLAILASAILSFIDNFVVVVVQEIGLWQFQVLRAAMALPLIISGAVLLKQRIRPVSWRSTALRSLVVSSGLLLYFASLGVLPVPQAGAGLFSAPLWVALFSTSIFKAPMTARQVMVICLGFAGVLLLLQPDLSNLTVLALLPLFAGAFYGLGMLLTPHLCRNEHPITLAIGIFICLGVGCLVPLIGFSLAPIAEPDFLSRGLTVITPEILGLTLLQAIGAIVAVTLIAQAYRIGSPPLVSVSEYSFLVFGTLWGVLLWQVAPNFLAVSGVVVIILSGAMLARLTTKADTSKT